MFKSAWKFVLCGSLLTLGTHTLAQTPTTAPIRQPDWSVELHTNSAPLTTATQLFLAEGGTGGTPGSLQAFDAATGKKLWNSDRPIGTLFSITNQTIYATDYGLFDSPQNLVTLDANTGKTQSVLPIDDLDLAEVIGTIDDAFILKSYVKRGYELDHDKFIARTPKQVLWSFETPTESQVSDKDSKIHNGILVLPILVNPSTDQRGFQLTALDAKTGKQLWFWNTRAEIATTVWSNTVYPSVYSSDRAGLQPGWVKALDLKTGKERWTHTMLGGYAEMASDREVFIRDQSQKTSTQYVVLDQQTGTVLREITLTPDENPDGRTILANNTIYKVSWQRLGTIPGTAKNHSWIEAFDATTGQLKWRTPTLYHSHINRFAVEGDRLVVIGSGLDRDTKSVVQSFRLP